MSDQRQGPRYGQPDREYAMKLATTPEADDGPIWMVNFMHYHDVAQYEEGQTATISGREADELYNPVDVLSKIGAVPVFVADVDAQLLGDSPQWDRVAIVRYASRRSFIEMQSREDFQSKHVHKEAGMAETIVMGCQPIPSPMDGVDPSTLPEWSEVPHPPTDEDRPVVLAHLIRFHEGQAETNMVQYQQRAGEVAVPHGLRISGWLGVEGTIVGDGRRWDQVRFNAFPSKAAFMAVASDPGRLAAQSDHRDSAIADTYTLVLRPLIDQLAASTKT